MDFDRNIFKNLEIIAKLDTNIEVCLCNAEYMIDKFYLLNDIGVKIESLKKNCIVHLPFYGLQTASLDSSVSSYSQEALLSGIEAAKLMKSKKAVMHTGFSPFLPPKGYTKWKSKFFTSLDVLLQKATELDIVLLLENTWEPDPGLFNDVFREFHSPNLAVCLDIAHIFCFSDCYFSDWWEYLGNRVSHIHLSDNNLSHDDHLPLGTGKISYINILKMLKRKKLTYTLENKISDIPKSIEALSRIKKIS